MRCVAERGQALVETAITMPLLLLVALALVQFSFFAHAQHVVTAAAREGARTAATEGLTLDDGVTHAQRLLEAGLGRAASEVDLRAERDGEAVLFLATGRFRLAIPWVADVSLPLSARALVVMERFRPGGVANQGGLNDVARSR